MKTRRPPQRQASVGVARRSRAGLGTSRPFRRVLVANRGGIALRIIRACRELDVETVAVYSDADRDSRHVRAADVAVRLGPAPAIDSYLRTDLIVEAARRTGAEAVHPGYGFLSEQATFAAACSAAGLVFVGPAPVTLTGLGDKLAARRAAVAAGVPVVPGTLEPVTVTPADRATVDALRATADDIGWPLLVKAAAGGGGRGMRRVDSETELAPALVAASHEAAAAFGDGTVYLERLVAGARHVEVQLLGDLGGGIVALGERDCSVQRRHQKLVEEAPAPGLGPAERSDLHAHAVAGAGAVGLRNAATAEFLLEPDGSVWFLEVNARLQVEHGVTELVTGLDLVQEQLWLAAGRPLSDRVLAAAEAAAWPERHAIEVRLSAEDPAAAFAPAPGIVTSWREPSGPGVRVDGWIEPGTRVSSDYDPLLAKIMVVAEDRPMALARLARALDEVEVAGLQTTLPFDRWLVADPAFRSAELVTDFVDRRWDPAPAREGAARVAAALAAAEAGQDAFRSGGEGQAAGGTLSDVAVMGRAWRVAGRGGAAGGGPWAGVDRGTEGGDREGGRGTGDDRWSGSDRGRPARGRLRVTVEGDPPLVREIGAEGDDMEDPGGGGQASDDRPRAPWLVRPLPGRPEARARGAGRWEVVVGGWRFEVATEDAARAALRERASRAGASMGGAQRQVVRAQIPGRVVRVDVTAGQAVEAGQRLLSIEAMKMENEIRAGQAGTVARITATPGLAVERGQELVVIA